MKKVYFFAVALLATTTLFSQDGIDSVTFESYNLNGNDYYNGDDENGNIIIGDFTLSNNYDTQWDSWSGFAISKVQDATTSGWGNQYASYTGGGANGSSQYGVWYGGEIEFNTLRVVHSMQITNTTYAGISMRDGDAYGKQFGSPDNAAGTPDGTNGEDWFLLQIIPLDENDNVMGDTIDFYLADYRFADDNDDYIVNTWQTVDLNDVVAKKLAFKLSSSDNGNFGMNTPSYFALDNLVASPTVGVKSVTKIEASIFPNPATDKFVVKTTENGTMTITNTLGQVIKTVSVDGATTVDVSELPAGLYHATLTSKNGSNTQKVIVK